MSTEAAITELVLIDVVLIDNPGVSPILAKVVRNWTPPAVGYVVEAEPLALQILPGQSYDPDTITCGGRLQPEVCVGDYQIAERIRLRLDQLHLAAEFLLAGWTVNCGFAD